MYGLPMSRAKASQSSTARSGSGSRRSRGVNSCSAAVSTESFIGFGSKGVAVVMVGLRGAWIQKS
jgi:hypothetical protein